uniref:Mothers against decapentaplegic homolog n=1 Tax=Syphacia muris TaxID=451379 RepID=A0A0N5AS70_9BILA
MSSLFQYNCPAVKKLLGWKQGGEEEKWAEKAIDSLVKKLKKRKNGQGTLEDLEFALANRGLHSKCVTIPRSLDGRLQVSHRKGLPHVIYCRVWRWPNLQSHHELRSVPECMFPYENSSKQQPICINPYHYQRIESQCLFAMLIIVVNIFSYVGEIFEILASPSSMLSEDEQIVGTMHYERPYINLPSWGSARYYELNNMIGGPFQVFHCIKIDGYFGPSVEDRICIGSLISLHKNDTIQNTRKHIGKGNLNSEQDVCLTNCSESPIFVQSQNTNYVYKSPPDTVIRVPPAHSLKIFHFNEFLKNDPFCSAYKLVAMCGIRLSFVKGWGLNYPRKEVTSTPCWIELTLDDPLKVIIEYLFFDLIVNTKSMILVKWDIVFST